MDHIRNSILGTLIYYDILDFPLTLSEVHKYLINPKRFSNDSVPGDISLGSIAEELDNLVGGGQIDSKNGFYFLPGRNDLYELRIDREKIAAQKWKKFLRMAKWLSFNPCLSGFFSCGSVALGNTTKNSDFDVFVISRSNRLYTSRFFLWLIASLLGARRKTSDTIAPDKLCFNHHITDGDMFLKYQSLYTAQLYSNLKPVFMSPGLTDKFFASNIWMNEYLHDFSPQTDLIGRNVKMSFFSGIISKAMGLIFNSSAGDILENMFKKYQQDRIMQNPLTGQPGGRVVCTDTELEFHPHSFEGKVIEKYNQGLEKMGITTLVQEKDSGLTV